MSAARRPQGGGDDRTCDRGLSFVEVLVAVTLLGLAVAGTLPALWSSVRGSNLQDRLAGAQRWVVAAGDHAVSPSMGRIRCDTATAETIRASYESEMRAASAGSRPPGWSDSQLRVTSVRFWDGVGFPASGCFETASRPLPLQRIALQVTDPDGDVIETLEVVKGAG